MPPSVYYGTRSEQIRYIALLSFLFLCLLGGGASRVDVASLLYLRPAAVLCIVAILITPGAIEFRRYRPLFAMLFALAAIIAAQLVPLPPETWLSLPGRERYAEAIALAGGGAWHPISLVPDLTLNSLVALVVPLAALIGYAAIRLDQRAHLLRMLIVAGCASAVLGVLQLILGNDSFAYLYSVTHPWSPVGFFSNRNHQAALLAMLLPILAIWIRMPAADEQIRRTRFWTAILIGLFLVPVQLTTGSRAGMALTLIGLAAAALLGGRRELADASVRGRALLRRAILVILPIALAAVVIFFGRGLALQRLMGEDIQGDLRVEHTPLMLKMTADFFPLGTGFGTFDPVFRAYEPDASLDPRYFNRAHNDLIELLLNGGLPAALLLIAFLTWFAWSARAAFARLATRSPSLLLARLGAIMIAMMLLASLVDYPLRTPLMGVVFVIACGWLADRGGQRDRAPKAEKLRQNNGLL